MSGNHPFYGDIKSEVHGGDAQSVNSHRIPFFSFILVVSGWVSGRGEGERGAWVRGRVVMRGKGAEGVGCDILSSSLFFFSLNFRPMTLFPHTPFFHPHPTPTPPLSRQWLCFGTLVKHSNASRANANVNKDGGSKGRGEDGG